MGIRGDMVICDGDVDLGDEDGWWLLGWGVLERAGRRMGLGWLAEKGTRAKQRQDSCDVSYRHSPAAVSNEEGTPVARLVLCNCMTLT